MLFYLITQSEIISDFFLKKPLSVKKVEKIKSNFYKLVQIVFTRIDFCTALLLFYFYSF